MSSQIHLDPVHRPPAAAEQPVDATAVQRREVEPVRDSILVEDSTSPLESLWNCVSGCFMLLFTSLWDCLKTAYEALFSPSRATQPEDDQPMTLERRVGPDVLQLFNGWSSEWLFSKFQFPCKIFIAIKIYQSHSEEQPEITIHAPVQYTERNLELYRTDLRNTLQTVSDAIANNEDALRARELTRQHKIEIALVASHKIPRKEEWNVITSEGNISSGGPSGGITEAVGDALYASGLVVTRPALKPIRGDLPLLSSQLFDEPPEQTSTRPHPTN